MRGEIIQMDSTGLIYQECLRVLQSGHDVVLATIFEARGSAPRTAGAKMVVRSDGTTLGTIGGGRLENDVTDVARRLFVSRRSAIHSFDLTGKDLAAMDMICGGCGEVWLHFLTAADSNDLAVCQATVGVLSRRESGCLITEISDSNGARDRQFCLIGPDNSATGRLTIGDRRLDRWIGRSGKFSARTETFNDQRFLIEPIQPCCTAFIFGEDMFPNRWFPSAKRSIFGPWCWMTGKSMPAGVGFPRPRISECWSPLKNGKGCRSMKKASSSS